MQLIYVPVCRGQEKKFINVVIYCYACSTFDYHVIINISIGEKFLIRILQKIADPNTLRYISPSFFFFFY
jgi:hypothetical protein